MKPVLGADELLIAFWILLTHLIDSVDHHLNQYLRQNLKYKNGLNVLESAYMVAIGPTSAMAASRTIEAVLPCAREISRPE